MAPLFPLVVIVHADLEVRLRRLVEQRGMPEEDARARTRRGRRRATPCGRRRVAGNSGTQEDLVERARDVWNNRILPFAHNLTQRQIVRAAAHLVAADPTWPEQARRIVNRSKTACGHRALRVDHIGSTAVPDYNAKDVIDIQITVESLAVADELAEPLVSAVLPPHRAHHRRCRQGLQCRSPQHRRPLRSRRRSIVVAQADSRVGGSRTADERAYPGGRLA